MGKYRFRSLSACQTEVRISCEQQDEWQESDFQLPTGLSRKHRNLAYPKLTSSFALPPPHSFPKRLFLSLTSAISEWQDGVPSYQIRNLESSLSPPCSSYHLSSPLDFCFLLTLFPPLPCLMHSRSQNSSVRMIIVLPHAHLNSFCEPAALTGEKTWNTKPLKLLVSIAL